LIKAIFATDLQGGMGYQNSLPWPHDKEDLRNFKQTTTDNIVVMGSNTWIDPMMPKPLPNRTCVVVTNQDVKIFDKAHEVIAGTWLKESLEMLDQHNPDKTIWVIGGAKLLMSCRPYVKEINLTTFMTEYNCDVKLNMAEYLVGFGKMTEEFGRNKIYSTWTRL
jgi:dihydrofolate reductase